MLVDPSGRVYPPFVQTTEQRKRWDSCTNVAMAAWEKVRARTTHGDMDAVHDQLALFQRRPHRYASRRRAFLTLNVLGGPFLRV